jgi:drug/metabolite transporter (DMT)-like permease
MQNWSDDMKGSMLMIAAMAAFTFNDTCMKAVTADLPLFQSILLRGIATSALVFAVAVRTGGLRLDIPARDWFVILLRTIGEVAGTFAFLAALRHMPLANLSAILQSLPLLVTLGAAILFRESIGWRRMLAILVGFVGVLLIIRPGTEGFDRWALLGVVSVLFVVLRDLATRRLSREVPSITVALCSAVAVAVSAGLAVPFAGWQTPTGTDLLLILLASVFLVAGYLASVMAMRVGAIAAIAPFRYTSLVFALILGLVVFGQFPDGLTLAGAAIVICTGLYSLHRERRRASADARAGR